MEAAPAEPGGLRAPEVGDGRVSRDSRSARTLELIARGYAVSGIYEGIRVDTLCTTLAALETGRAR